MQAPLLSATPTSSSNAYLDTGLPPTPRPPGGYTHHYVVSPERLEVLQDANGAFIDLGDTESALRPQ